MGGLERFGTWEKAGIISFLLALGQRLPPQEPSSPRSQASWPSILAKRLEAGAFPRGSLADLTLASSEANGD